jgi:Sigma-70 factor, region 1.2
MPTIHLYDLIARGKMYQTISQPLPSIGSGLAHYLTQVRKFPILTQEEETAFARRWCDHGDREAAYRLVTSHLRLVAKIAMRYRGYPSHIGRMEFAERRSLGAKRNTGLRDTDFQPHALC